jgi:hypothetical protein
MSDAKPLFRFQTVSEDPPARVTCLACGWHVTGPSPDVVFPLADAHFCRTGVARHDGELVGAVVNSTTLSLADLDAEVAMRRVIAEGE